MGSLLERLAHPSGNLYTNETISEGQSFSRYSKFTQFAGPILCELEENEEEVSERLQDLPENLGLSVGKGQNPGTLEEEVCPRSQTERLKNDRAALR